MENTVIKYSHTFTFYILPLAKQTALPIVWVSLLRSYLLLQVRDVAPRFRLLVSAYCISNICKQVKYALKPVLYVTDLDISFFCCKVCQCVKFENIETFKRGVPSTCWQKMYVLFICGACKRKLAIHVPTAAGKPSGASIGVPANSLQVTRRGRYFTYLCM
jgi:hypothetical protein